MTALVEGLPWEVALSFGSAGVVFILAQSIRRFLLKQLRSSEELVGKIDRLSAYWPVILALYTLIEPNLPRILNHVHKLFDLYLYVPFSESRVSDHPLSYHLGHRRICHHFGLSGYPL